MSLLFWALSALLRQCHRVFKNNLLRKSWHNCLTCGCIILDNTMIATYLLSPWQTHEKLVWETRARNLYVCHTELQQDISRTSFSHQIEHVLFHARYRCEFLVGVSRRSVIDIQYYDYQSIVLSYTPKSYTGYLSKLSSLTYEFSHTCTLSFLTNLHPYLSVLCNHQRPPTYMYLYCWID